MATCAEVEVEKASGRIRVLKLCTAFECGAIHNPMNLKAQVDGCVVMGIGGALRESIQFEKGRILNGRFAEYLVPRFNDLPELDTVLLDRPDLPVAGAGETPIIAVAPAIANAVFHATGTAPTKLPLVGLAPSAGWNRLDCIGA